MSDFANVNGGQAKVAVDTARLLANSGKNVIFFAACGEPDKALDHPLIKIRSLNQADILSDDNRARAIIRGLWNAEAARELRRICGELSPVNSLVHCHGYAKALSPAIGPILADGPLPSLYTMHEYFLACPNGGFYDYQRNEICRRRPLGVSCLTTDCDVRNLRHKAWRVVRQLSTWGAGRMPRGLTDIAYISETQLRAMEPYLPSSAQLHYLPNPIDVEGRDVVVASENDLFVSVGRLNPEKGGRLFAKAARIAGVQAVFVGDGTEASVIRKENPEAIVTGWQSHDKVHEWLGRARALVFPSLWYECQPLVPLEALVRGVPVVAGRWTAASEVIEHQVSGVLFDRPDADVLAAALREVSTLGPFDPSPYRDAASPERHLGRLFEIYDGILDRAKGRIVA
ncbi:MAG: glycosyltransferase family 4 protein [Gammaproteobacteria bacterium]